MSNNPDGQCWESWKGWGCQQKQLKLNVGGKKQWASTMIRKSRGNQHLEISAKSRIILHDLEISVTPCKSEICLKHVGYLFDNFGQCCMNLGNLVHFARSCLGILVHLGR